MEVINFGKAEACAAAWLGDGTSEYGVEHARVLTMFRNLLRTSQDNNSTVEATATAMANAIRESAWQGWCSEVGGGDIYHAAPYWANMMNMVEEIPVDHPWHAVFVRTVHILHGLVGERVHPCYTETWDELSRCLRWDFWDFWEDRSKIFLNFFFFFLRKEGNANDDISPPNSVPFGPNPVPFDRKPGGAEEEKEIVQWKRWTSLFAQMPREIADAYYSMRAIKPLESPAEEDAIAAECLLWTTCEWLIYTAYTALECLRAHAIDGDALEMGELYRRDVGDPCSLQRWDWWKQRLRALAVDADTATKQHVARALASMEAAEAWPSEVEELAAAVSQKEGGSGQRLEPAGPGACG